MRSKEQTELQPREEPHRASASAVRVGAQHGPLPELRALSRRGATVTVPSVTVTHK